VSEEGEEKKEFTITDRRFSKQEEEDTSGEDRADAQSAPEPEEPVREEEPQAPSGGDAEGPPQANFAGFVLSLANTALINMGVVPDPMGGTAEVQMEGAKQMIDILGILQEKTQGNLNDEESHLLEQILTEVRMRFVDITRSGGAGGVITPPMM
jgi:hypothetical protein